MNFRSFGFGQNSGPLRMSSSDDAKRKTSAQLINEAKNYLGETQTQMEALAISEMNTNGLFVINTRRPVTPKEPSRTLYGKVALPGRPPSAFSMKYLQKENQRLPKTPPLDHFAISNTTIVEEENTDVPVRNATPRKLPALEFKPKTEPFSRQSSAEEKNVDLAHIDLKNTRQSLQRQNMLLAQSSTESLIELLKEYQELKDCTDETAIHINTILTELYERMRRNNANHRKQIKRSLVLGGIYGLVECSSARVLLGVARIVLALHVTGSNLTGACKLIFKVARNEKNDYLFRNNDVLELLIEGLGRANPLEDAEACTYGYGSIRFLANKTPLASKENTDNSKYWNDVVLQLPPKPATAPAPNTKQQNMLAEYLLNHGAADLMILHLQILNEAAAVQQLSGPPLHTMYQLSTVFRSFADLQPNINILLPEENVNTNINMKLLQACPHLIRAAEVCFGEIEIQANIVRTLSILSENTACCQNLSEHAARIGMLLGPCCQFMKDSPIKILPICSRLGYILGNIMAKFDEARVKFYHNDVAMEYLITILRNCLLHKLTLQNNAGDSICDVLIKLMRVIANLTVNDEVGIGLTNINYLGKFLSDALNIAYQQPVNAQMNLSIFELKLGILAALHNLCFFQNNFSQFPSQVLKSVESLQTTLTYLAVQLCTLIQNDADESTRLEAIRVLGNLTRNIEARQAFCKANGLTLMMQQLDSIESSYELKACTMGVLVNLLTDTEQRQKIKHLNGIELMVSHLSTALDGQFYSLATIVTQALWNLFIDTPTHELTTVGNGEESEVIYKLFDLLTENLNTEDELDSDSGLNDQWENFCVVGTDLLERLDKALDKTNVKEINNIQEQEEYDDNDDVHIEELHSLE